MTFPSLRTLVALIAAAAVTVAVAMLYLVPPAQPAQNVRDNILALDTWKVSWSDQIIPVYTQGQVSARHQLPLSLEVSGRVEEVAPAFADGGRVMAGEILLRLDPEPFELEVITQQNAVQAARLHLAETRARARVAGSASRSSALGRFEPQMDEARSRLAAAQAGLRQAQRQLEQTELVAAISGRLKGVQVMPGQHLQAGTVLGQLYQEDLVEVRLPVRDDWLALLGIVPGDDSTLEPVQARLSGRFAGRTGEWQGKVVRREGGLNRNQMMHLIVQVANHEQDLPLEPGVLVQAELRGAPTQAVAVLPRSAQAGEDSIWVLDDEQRLRRQTVVVLHHDRDNLYVNDGVTSSTRAVLAGDLQLLEGMRINPNPPAPGLANMSGPLQ
ncbi:efflux RND transporter periplasmic adaptor subunit [Alcanivorax sp. DP30]|uniref:efflux RND transporter periplasmic adaptor subunit n=1 Tax=Alcanivorax sp. DP30 TaxID=2606217 RepID=UPI0013712BE9|nr:efflux RND transporter periplasmic adaptor subunit [Alcanivorax sp. DP30]MZR64034.1 efflux RND transporter periplasmic adaptor subunit [Alcanivorax sp. DP30]